MPRAPDPAHDLPDARQEEGAGAGFGIYIHWPFCLSKCPYCDFNSHVAREIDQAAWCAAYLKAIDCWREYRAGEKLISLYFGGGTPSLAEASTIGAIIDHIASIWNLEGAEITLEANPATLDAERFRGFAAAGVGRLSLGLQELDDEALRALGRVHDVSQSLAALSLAQTLFAEVNFDLIYARQHQSLADWQAELARALDLGAGHMSLYQLGVEPNTIFGARARQGKLKGLPSNELAAKMFEWTSARMIEAGYRHYEISNFAGPGKRSRHNLIYWRGGEYLGIGPGAHGRVGADANGRIMPGGAFRLASMQASIPADWLGSPESFAAQVLRADEALGEYLMMALRSDEGVRFEHLDALCGTGNSRAAFDYELLEPLIASGHIWRENRGFGVTNEGRLLLDHITAQLLPEPPA